jgi:HPr kinase/phosphorylase
VEVGGEAEHNPAKLLSGVTQTIHGTGLALGDKGVLIRGASGTGKSDLALRCLAMPPNQIIPLQSQLIADDRVVLTMKGGAIWMEAPDPIAGLIEVRGIDIVAVGPPASARLTLIVDLVPVSSPIERLPNPHTTALLGNQIATLALHGFEASAAIKLLLALQASEQG